MPLNNKDVVVVASHALLAGTGIYCLVQSKDAEFFFPPHVTFGLFAVNGLMALTAALVDDSAVHRIFEVTAYSELLFALPCINTQVWLDNGYQKALSYAWTIVPLVPFVIFMVKADVDMPLADLLIVLNLLGLGAVSIINNVNYGIAATAAYIVSYFCTKKLDQNYGFLYNVGLCFFAYFGLRAIGLGHDLF